MSRSRCWRRFSFVLELAFFSIPSGDCCQAAPAGQAVPICSHRPRAGASFPGPWWAQTSPFQPAGSHFFVSALRPIRYIVPTVLLSAAKISGLNGRIASQRMNCFVTGASGFIGANLVHELVARGHRVKALLRPGADLRGLAGAQFERSEGDVSDREPLEKAMRGCDWCFHVAASYHLWLRDYRPMYAANVEGTRNVLEAAAAAGCARIVYTSTVGCIGLPKPIGGRL